MTDKIKNKVGNSKPTDGVVGVQTMDRLAQSAHDGIDAASEAAHPTIDRATAGAHHAVDNADEAIAKVSAKGRSMAAKSANYMREHPMLTLSLAVGTGYLLSRLLTKH